MCGWRAGLYAIVAFVGFTGATTAATFRGIELVEDGSLVPPGDILRVAMTLYPKDKELRYEIRAYVIPMPPIAPPAPAPDPNGATEAEAPAPERGEIEGPPEPDPVLVRTSNPQMQDPKGNYRQVISIPCPERTIAYQEEFTVAFADLALEQGVYQLGYEVTVYRGDSLQFVCATPLGKIEITPQPRAMQQRIPTFEPLVTQEETVVLQDGQLVTQTRPVTLQLKSFELGDTVVSVPGGFVRRREMAFAAPGDGGLDSNPKATLSARVNQERAPWAEYRTPLIYFATNRLVVPRNPVQTRFTINEAQAVTYGTVRVNLPQIGNHQRGNVETPKHFWNRLDPKKHFFLEETSNLLSEAEVLQILMNSIKASENDLLVFVHGFDNSFEDAALRIAQLRMDAHFPGQVMLFSWPSLGKAGQAAYREDEKRSERAIPHLAGVLKKLAINRSRLATPGDIHLAAHSMGNRVLLGALMELTRDPEVKSMTPFGHIIYAAPDEVAQKFELEVKATSAFSKTRTLYYCSVDVALIASQLLNMNINRAGQVLIPIPGLDNINADQANTSILGHDYFVSANPLLSDIEVLLNFDRPPSNRPPLAMDRLVNYTFWKFP